MIFDENGGRIVGGRLDSQQPGGTLSYVGVVNKSNLGMMANVAFEALKELRYRSMIVRLDGDLAGEFATRLTIDQLGLGGGSGPAKILRGAFRKVPFQFNITIKGPFRVLDPDSQIVSRPARADQRRPATLARRYPGHHHRCPARRRTEYPDPDSACRAGQSCPATHDQVRDEMKHAFVARPALLGAALIAAPLTSCVSVKTPDKPIEINLNVTIRQEVLVRLQRDVEQLINQNPQAFPQPQPPK